MGVYRLAVFSSEIPKTELVLHDYGNPLAVGIILYKLCRVIYPPKSSIPCPNSYYLVLTMTVLMTETPVFRMSANSGMIFLWMD